MFPVLNKRKDRAGIQAPSQARALRGDNCSQGSSPYLTWVQLQPPFPHARSVWCMSWWQQARSRGTGDAGRGIGHRAASHRRLNWIYLSSSLHVQRQQVDRSFKTQKLDVSNQEIKMASLARAPLTFWKFERGWNTLLKKIKAQVRETNGTLPSVFYHVRQWQTTPGWELFVADRA